MKHLTKYIAQRNVMAAIFKQKVYDVKKLTAEDKQELIDRIEGDLSPENLCCDGELRGAMLQAKARMLYGAKAELEAMGFKVTPFTYS
jgi:hypothetical protein